MPAIDARGANFLDYEHHVHLGKRATRTEVAARASLLVLRRQPAPRPVCLAEGSDILGPWRWNFEDFGHFAQLFCAGGSECDSPTSDAIHASPPY